MRWRRLLRPLAWGLCAGALALVFGWYQNPALMVDLANQLWACF